MHWRVLPSPWTMPMPNLASAPSSAISSVAIWPVLEERDRLRAVLGLDRLERACTNVDERGLPVDGFELAARVAQQRRAWRGRARASGVSASQPLGQAMPRLTG